MDYPSFQKLLLKLHENPVLIPSCKFLDVSNIERSLPYVIFGVPYEKHGSVRKGARFGPWAIREISRYAQTFDLNTGIEIDDKLVDIGDVELDNVNDDPKEELNKIEAFVNENISQSQFPVALGGDHLITLPIFKSFIKRYRGCILHFDAHLDIYDLYPYPPAANEAYTHATAFRRIVESGAEQIISIGIRSVDSLEFDFLQSEDRIHMISSYEIHKKGTKVIDKELQRVIEPFGQIYLSLDLDVFDPAFAPGVSTPEPYGISPWEFLKLLGSFSNKLIGCDVVELCPPFDNGITSMLAAKTIVDIICARERSLKK